MYKCVDKWVVYEDYMKYFFLGMIFPSFYFGESGYLFSFFLLFFLMLKGMFFLVFDWSMLLYPILHSSCLSPF